MLHSNKYDELSSYYVTSERK